MAISITQLESELQTQITALSSGNEHDELLMAALSVALINGDKKNSVSVVGDLPDIGTDSIPAGTIVFVEDYQVPVICDGFSWRGLDGRRLRSDVIEERGEIWVFGENNYGQLGTNNTTCYSSPVQEVSGINSWIDISAGSAYSTSSYYSRSFAINKKNEAHYGWGSGNYSLLIGNTNSQSSPTPGLNRGFKKVRAGAAHTLLLESETDSPRIYAGGFNNVGQLGTNNLTNQLSNPTIVTGSITDWTDIAAGENTSYGLRSNGTLWSWGLNNFGQLGTNDVTCYSSPVQEASSSTTWVSISGAKSHSAAIKSDGTLWLWGYNANGELGVNDTINYSSPVQEASSSTNWESVECGAFYTMAIKTDGTLWGWGWNQYGNLSTNNLISYSSPVQETSSSTNWSSVHCAKIAGGGENHTIGIKTDGTLWGWGQNERGQLGTNNTVSYSSPVQEISSSTDWSSAALSYRSTIAIRNKI